MRIKFVTDSVADIPPQLVQKWGIAVVPCYVNYGGKSYADDGIELIREDYYNQLATMPEVPKTSAMPPDVARAYIEPAFAEADHLIIITTPAKLSGIYNAMRLAVADLPPERVTLIDSGQLSIGIGWQVLVGAEVAAQTGSLEKTLAAIAFVKANQKVYAMVDSLSFLRRSGRVNALVASVGTLLQIKPIVQVETGDVNSVARVRTLKRAMDKMAALARKHAPYDEFAILHINNPSGMEDLRTRIADILPSNPIVGTIGPTLGTHTGPGVVGFATVGKGWKDAIGT